LLVFADHQPHLLAGPARRDAAFGDALVGAAHSVAPRDQESAGRPSSVGKHRGRILRAQIPGHRMNRAKRWRQIPWEKRADTFTIVAQVDAMKQIGSKQGSSEYATRARHGHFSRFDLNQLITEVVELTGVPRPLLFRYFFPFFSLPRRGKRKNCRLNPQPAADFGRDRTWRISANLENQPLVHQFAGSPSKGKVSRHGAAFYFLNSKTQLADDCQKTEKEGKRETGEHLLRDSRSSRTTAR